MLASAIRNEDEKGSIQYAPYTAPPAAAATGGQPNNNVSSTCSGSHAAQKHMHKNASSLGLSRRAPIATCNRVPNHAAQQRTINISKALLPEYKTHY